MAHAPAAQARTLRRLRARTFVNHGYVEAAGGGYMLTIVDRGGDALVDAGRVGAECATALKSEARRRSEACEFFGRIAYASLIARKPG